MTDTPLLAAIKAIARNDVLQPDALERAFDEILSGSASSELVAAFLMGLAVRGETAQELIAGARIMRNHSRRHPVQGDLLDTCGTGGLPWKSLNTSTASALVIAAAGGRVAKHGNRSVPPKTGSADVLEALGVNLDVDTVGFQACLDHANVAFMFARTHHAAMRHVAPIRAALGIRTIFNLLGPLTNPAGANHQILGVYAPEWVVPVAEALAALGTKRAWVVHGVDGIDEISISGTTRVAEVQNGQVTQFDLEPETAGLTRHPLSRLEGGSVSENADAIRLLLDGHIGPFRDVVCLNAGAGLMLLGLSADLKAGVAQAQMAIDSGGARDTLQRLADASYGRNI